MVRLVLIALLAFTFQSSAALGQGQLNSVVLTPSDPIDKINLANSAGSFTVTLTFSDTFGALSPNNNGGRLQIRLQNGAQLNTSGLVADHGAGTNTVTFTGQISAWPGIYDGTLTFTPSFTVAAASIGAQPTPVSGQSVSTRIAVDRVAPSIQSIQVIDSRLIEITFNEANLKRSYPRDHFVVTANSNTVTLSGPNPVSVIGNKISIPLPGPVTGLVNVIIQDFNGDSFSDSFENPLGNVSQTVVATTQRSTGPAVDYPEFVVPKTAPNHSDNDKIRPSGRVVSRVIRLYYYRDAHRVAEIINRRVQQYNITNVNTRRSSAEQARIQAEEATSARRQAQRVAEQTAQETRRKERELQQAQIEAEESRIGLAQLATFPAEYIVVPDVFTNQGYLIRPREASDAAGVITVAQLRTQLEGGVERFEELSATVDSLRINEQATNNRARALEDDESRLIKEQFIREVRAAKEDPNTYARGEIDSPDPVAQTSVSVIGEGVIQLRGPIAGINQIRRMVHQIDMPVGQVKVDIQTVQINGEKGDELEETIQLTEGYINIGRFLTNQSLVFIRRSVAEVAAEVASEHGQPWERNQQGRDLRYLYGFFGQDFIDTLYRMDSEFLNTENQILSLHSMDSISRNRALVLLGLCKNSVRQRIMEKFEGYIASNLPELEYKYRLANKAIPCECLPECTCKEKLSRFLHPHRCECPLYTIDNAVNNANLNYQFLNFKNFFEQGVWTDATLNPIQREFIRLAQVFKSQLIAEIELKQRIVERGLMNQRVSDDEQFSQDSLKEIRTNAIERRASQLNTQLDASTSVSKSIVEVVQALQQSKKTAKGMFGIAEEILQGAEQLIKETQVVRQSKPAEEAIIYWDKKNQELLSLSLKLERIIAQSESVVDAFGEIKNVNREVDIFLKGELNKSGKPVLNDKLARDTLDRVGKSYRQAFRATLKALEETGEHIRNQYERVLLSNVDPEVDWANSLVALAELGKFIPEGVPAWKAAHDRARAAISETAAAGFAVSATNTFLNNNRPQLPQLKLLDHLIDEHEEKAMDLLEGRRAHISAIDNFLKRMTFALEDDFQVQFYDPALVCIRSAARGRNVGFSQVERTTVLGNNRELLKVRPEATMEFDLPNRQLRVNEAMRNAKALVDDYGGLLKDPTFLAAFQLSGGGTPAGTVQNVLPSLEGEPNQEVFSVPGASSGGQLGSSLQSLVPDPAVYQFETGTGFEVRPVIQPDGDSLVYDLTYLYTTDLREPVRADEKHLGRVKRHFIHTQVQTSSFELREVGRFQVALKASRTGRGVPGLENRPIVGGLFRPAPSEESSIQQNILLGKSVVYPTLFDLMGLEWAQSVAELDYDQIRNAGHVARGRQSMVQQHVFDKTSENVDNFLRIDKKGEHHRPDLYRQHSTPSPYHPNGYVYPHVRDDQDVSRRGFRVPEKRPLPYKQGDGSTLPAPGYDDRFRKPISNESYGVPESYGAPESFEVPLSQTQPPYETETPARAQRVSPVQPQISSSRRSQLR